MADDLGDYLDPEEPARWPWQLKFFLVMAVLLVVEVAAIALASAL